MATREGGRTSSVDLPATIAGTAAAVVVSVAIYLGSRRLANFDAALVGYACATIFLAFGIVYRYSIWVQSPPTARFLRRGWGSFLSLRNFRQNPDLVPKALVTNLALQTFIKERGTGRWLAHQSLFWGVVIATLVTFPLTFGWLRFEAAGESSTQYAAYIWDLRVFTFDPLSFIGWVTFHILDLTAVLVIAGCVYFMWRRLRDRGATTGQRFGYDMMPLISLIAISITGLLMTFSSVFLEGQGYDFLAITHMAVVVLTLVFIPFGKFFHVVQRPASIGVDVYKRSNLASDGAFRCKRCEEPIEAAGFVQDLETTMDELGLRFDDWPEYCPRCKRVLRGQAYLDSVKRGFE